MRAGISMSAHSPMAWSRGSTNRAGPGSTWLHASSSAASAWLTTLRAWAARIWARVTEDRSVSAERPSGPESWAMRPPVVAHATSPAMTSIGTRSRLADAIPVTALVMPGPAVTTTAGTRPLARWNSAAENAACDSCRDSTRRAPGVSRMASNTGHTGPPGIPKNVSTPRSTSASNQSTRSRPGGKRRLERGIRRRAGRRRQLANVGIEGDATADATRIERVLVGFGAFAGRMNHWGLPSDQSPRRFAKLSAHTPKRRPVLHGPGQDGFCCKAAILLR